MKNKDNTLAAKQNMTNKNNTIIFRPNMKNKDNTITKNQTTSFDNDSIVALIFSSCASIDKDAFSLFCSAIKTSQNSFSSVN